MGLLPEVDRGKNEMITASHDEVDRLSARQT